MGGYFVCIFWEVILYRKLAIKITDFFISKKTIDETKKAIYQYGFEMLISSLFYTLIFLAIAFLTDSFFESIIFWLGLFMIRKTAGGHHASSYITYTYMYSFIKTNICQVHWTMVNLTRLGPFFYTSILQWESLTIR